jgi:MFS family permease
MVSEGASHNDAGVTARRADRRRLTAVLIGNGVLRVANAAGGALIGFYLAHLAAQGYGLDAALVGALGVIINTAELAAALPLGVLADHVAPRVLLVAGALLGAVATQLFGISGLVAIFFVSRALEGIASATSGAPLLAYLSDVTQKQPALRGRMMSFYELALLAGLALGGLVGGVLWDTVKTISFSLLALVYLGVAGLFAWGMSHSTPRNTSSARALAGLHQALSDPLLRRLAPAWLAMNAIVGLWLTHITFQLSGSRVAGQYLAGRFSASEVGVILLGYALVFGVGVTAWGFALAHMARVRALRINLAAMLGACLCLSALNTSEGWPAWLRWVVVALTAGAIMVESGFTPTALAYLADVAGQREGRGAAMGTYTVLLAIGTALGAGLGGLLARGFAFNGLIVGTVGLALLAMAALVLLPDVPV